VAASHSAATIPSHEYPRELQEKFQQEKFDVNAISAGIQVDERFSLKPIPADLVQLDI